MLLLMIHPSVAVRGGASRDRLPGARGREASSGPGPPAPPPGPHRPPHQTRLRDGTPRRPPPHAPSPCGTPRTTLRSAAPSSRAPGAGSRLATSIHDVRRATQVLQNRPAAGITEGDLLPLGHLRELLPFRRRDVHLDLFGPSFRLLRHACLLGGDPLLLTTSHDPRGSFKPPTISGIAQSLSTSDDCTERNCCS